MIKEKNAPAQTRAPQLAAGYAGRYRLYAALSCPFAHRVRMVRLFHGLEEDISITYPIGQSMDGFFFSEPEPVTGALLLRDVYRTMNVSYAGKFTTPLLIDNISKSIISNDSIAICYALNQMRNSTQLDIAPEGAEAVAADISENVTVIPYKFLFSCGEKKEPWRQKMFGQLDRFEHLLSERQFVIEGAFTVADCVLWPVLVRFDNVYARQFGLDGKSIRNDYPNLRRYIRRVAFVKTVAGGSLGLDINLPEVIRLYWQSESLASKAGNDPRSSVPYSLPVLE